MAPALSPSVQRAVARVQLRSEVWRAWLVLGAALVLLLGVLTLGLYDHATPQARVRQMRGASVLAILVAYDSVILAVLLRRRNTGRPTSSWFRYANTVVEVSLPTVVVLVLAPTVGWLQALAGAAPFAYFVLILFTTLYLDSRLCGFAGVIAAVQYGWLANVALKNQTAVPGWEILVSPGAHGMKTVILLLTGFAAGFVAAQIRSQMVTAVQSASERDRAVGMFGQHVSPQVADLLLRQPLEFSGEERDVCVLFLDIRDFSKLAAASAPSEVMRYLNTVFGELIRVVNRHQGIVNKFLGDGFMAVFGAPVNDGSSCEHGVAAAKEILAAVETLNRTGVIPATRVGMGLHVGEAVTGNVGSEERKEYTIIGDVVNLAARIEQATKQYQAQLLVSEAVYRRLDAPLHPATDLGEIELKGQLKPTRLYQLA
ncbi:MAG: adenylate/guanylate cyclase domain-containing protein [Verrucomicrobiales bacterium]|nr:adenylate/guanylate cyclase domain-containing protein [Verrucomicrobiales bacterium]